MKLGSYSTTQKENAKTYNRRFQSKRDPDVREDQYKAKNVLISYFNLKGIIYNQCVPLKQTTIKHVILKEFYYT
jgi:hypothetical protein